MDYCGPRGIPHSKFKAWDQLDQDKSLAWQQRERETHTCGVHPDVWDAERGGDAGSMRLVTRLCEACELAERSAEEFQKERMPGTYQVWQFGLNAHPTGVAGVP